MAAIVTEPVRVEIGSLERELADIWVSAAEGAIPGVTAPVTRALLSNVLIYAANDAEADEAAQTIVEIAADHPARVVISDAEEAPPGEAAQADLSMLCSITETGRRLCGEEIRLHPHGLAEAALGTLMPVLVPDLPVYLWTPGELPADDDLLRQLVRTADHWIVDSRRLPNWTDDLNRVIAIGLRHEPSVALHDLAWASLSQWREVVAQQFDPPAAREYLRGVSGVEIAYKPREADAPSVESVLMGTWLASQLGWQRPRLQKQPGGGWAVTSAADTRELAVTLTPAPTGRLPIERVVIESDLDGKHGVFRAAQADSSNEVTLEADAPGVPSARRTVRMAPSSRSAELRQVLDGPSKDPLYERVLAVLQEA